MSKRVHSRFLVSLCLCMACFLLITPLFMGESNAKSKFPSKTITYIIPTSPGGGFDVFSRLIIPYLKKYLPGNPNIIIKNIPGAGWNIGITKLYHAKPDGHTIGIMMPANCVNQVVAKTKFDLRKMTWMGCVAESIYVGAVAKKSTYKTVEDLKKADLVVVATVGLTTMNGLSSLVTAQTMGIKAKFLPHVGSTEAILAALRGDPDVVQFPYTTLNKSIVDSKDLIPLWSMSEKRLDVLPDVPTVGELGYPDLINMGRLIRITGGPPGMPADVAKIWRDAFWKATNDPEYQKKQLALDATPHPMKHGEIETAVGKAFEIVTKHKALIMKYRK